MSEKALELVKECLATKNPYLYLGKCGLTDEDFVDGTSLDITLRKCTHLQTLILSNGWKDGIVKQDSNIYGTNNVLNNLPSGICELTALKTLICCGTINEKWGISDITIIYKLRRLERLNLSYNQIREMSGLENLTALLYFDISNNQISEIRGLENSTSIEYLSVYYNQIRELKGVENLVRLRHFDISHNHINEIKGLENLTALQDLYIYSNQISELKGLENLTTLKKLVVFSNKISELKGLENLTALQDFDVSHNKIKELKGLENLTALQSLVIYTNQIIELKGLDNLTALQNLSINSNQISELKGLENLTRLKRLDISCNQITKLRGLENLTALQKLDLSSNNIVGLHELLPFIARKNSPLEIVFKYNGTNLKPYEIKINGNPLESPPVEVAQRGNEAILNYFEQLERQGTAYLYEAKMLIVGQPRAGKTTLRYKLFDASSKMPDEEETTRGIDIQRLEFDIIDPEGKQRKFSYSIWDFGGQHIYLTTHQFFLTHRSLYVLVIDAGKDSAGNEDNSLNYWLQALELLSGGSPLLLVRNEKGDRKINIDIPQKRVRFDFLKMDHELNLNSLIVGTASFKLDQLKKFEVLKQDIHAQLSQLPLVGFQMPKNWVRIRNELQEKSLKTNSMTTKEFMELCSKHDVIEYEHQMELSRIFHDLGIFLHFQDIPALEDFIILQNTWATDAVFAVLDNSNVQKNKGRFGFKDLAIIWGHKLYEPGAHGKLLQLMIQFELCYQIEKSYPAIYIIPEMLADTAPQSYVWLTDNDLPLRYLYDFMPKGILTRLIVRMHRTIFMYGDEQAVWKTGVKIDGNKLYCPNTEAEIIEAWDSRQLNINVHGPFAKDLLTRISQEIDQLNNEYFRYASTKEPSQRTMWYKMVPCNCITCSNSDDKHFFDYAELLERKVFGKQTIECKKRPFTDVNISELIDGVFMRASPNQSKSDIINVFISYSNKDWELKKLLIDGIAEHLDNKAAKYKFWSDTAIDIGADWKTEIEKALQESKVAILLVSASFAASKFIKEVELAEFFKRKKEGGYLILPVLIRSYDFTEFEQLSSINFFKTYYKDYGYNKPIERNKFFPFDVLGENEDATEKQLQDYYQKLSAYIHTAVTNHLNRSSIKNPPSSIE